MLRLRVRLQDLKGPWRLEGGTLWAGNSHVTPFGHRVLTTSVRINTGTARMLIQEPTGDFLSVDIMRRELRITAGSRGIAPLYLTVDDETLHASWEPAELHPFVEANALLDRAVVRQLTRRQRYSTDTLFANVRRLTERATAVFGCPGLRMQYPDDAEHALCSRPLRRGADPVQALHQLVAKQVTPIVRNSPIGLGLELSGGIDSAVVAKIVSQNASNPPTSLGVLVDGPTGLHQEDRRSELVRTLGLQDISLHVRDHLPFQAPGARTTDRPHYADGDVYREAFDVLRGRAKDAGVDVLFTGFGGDELMSLRSAERGCLRPLPDLPSWLGERARDTLPDTDVNIAPISPVAVPTLMAFAARHPAYLRFGLWPIAPLSDPVLLRFAESLPVEWRRDKTLLRCHLRRAGFGESVTHPMTMESFGDTMTSALQQHGPKMLSAMLDKSILVDQGFVDRGELARQYRNLAAGADVSPLLYDTLAVERGVQSMVAAGGVHEACG